MGRSFFLAIAAACGLAWAAPASAQNGEAAEGAIVAYRGATLIDGTGAAPRAGMTIIVDGARIQSVAADDSIEIPSGARVVDASALYVLPGLIDTHVHMATPPDAASARAMLRRQLYSGVTAVRDMADDLRSVAELSRQARVGEIPAPDIYYAALMAGESFFDDPRTHAVSGGAVPGHTPWMQAITNATDMREAVTLARGTSATAIKIYANLPASLVRKITREAHRQGIPIWAHTAVYPAMPADVAAAGVDIMSHACSLAHQGQAPALQPQSYASRVAIDATPFLSGDNPHVARVVADMARRGIILDATVRVYTEQERLRAENPERRPPLCSAALSYAMARQAHLAGVLLSAGTDGETAWEAPIPALIEELELLTDHVGLSPLEAIRAATQTAAAALNHSDEMGVIAPGRLANLMFTRDDPSADISNLRSVAFVVKRGLEFQRSDYQPISAEEVSGGGIW